MEILLWIYLVLLKQNKSPPDVDCCPNHGVLKGKPSRDWLATSPPLLLLWEGCQARKCSLSMPSLNLSNFLDFLFCLDNISSPPGAGEQAPGAVTSLSQPSSTFTFLSTSPIRVWITNHSTVATWRALHLSNKQGKAFLARKCLSEERQHPTMYPMSVENIKIPGTPKL